MQNRLLVRLQDGSRFKISDNNTVRCIELPPLTKVYLILSNLRRVVYLDSLENLQKNSDKNFVIDGDGKMISSVESLKKAIILVEYPL